MTTRNVLSTDWPICLNPGMKNTNAEMTGQSDPYRTYKISRKYSFVIAH